MYKNPSTASFTLKKSNRRAMLGTPRPLSLKKEQKADQNTPEIGRKLGRANVELFSDVLNKEVQKKAETVLEIRFKEADHLGNLDDVGGEKIRAPDLNAKRRSIEGNEGYLIKGLDPTGTHCVCILHKSL